MASLAMMCGWMSIVVMVGPSCVEQPACHRKATFAMPAMPAQPAYCQPVRLPSVRAGNPEQKCCTPYTHAAGCSLRCKASMVCAMSLALVHAAPAGAGGHLPFEAGAHHRSLRARRHRRRHHADGGAESQPAFRPAILHRKPAGRRRHRRHAGRPRKRPPTATRS